jgi:hypothetical protein
MQSSATGRPNWQAFGFASYLLIPDGGMLVRRV